MSKKKSGIVIHDVKKFLAPLKCFNSGIKSIVFSVENGTFSTNVGAPDNSQVANLVYSDKVISIGDKEMEKLSIYKLDEFISALSLFTQDNLTAQVNKNKLSIVFNDKASVNYILADENLITDDKDLSKPKVKLDFLLEFEVNESFIKKIKTVSKTLNVNNLKFVCKDGTLFYIICGDHKNSNNYEEKLIEDIEDMEDFEIAYPIRTEHRDNFGFLMDSLSYKIGIHPLVLKFTAKSDDYEKLDYYLAAREED